MEGCAHGRCPGTARAERVDAPEAAHPRRALLRRALHDHRAANEATDNAIDLTLQAASAAGGIELSAPERNLVKSVMGCAIDGSKLEDCGRQILVGQLGQLPPPAEDLADCLLKKGTVETCGQQAIIKTLGCRRS